MCFYNLFRRPVAKNKPQNITPARNKTIGYCHEKYWHAKNYCENMHIPAINTLVLKYTEKAKHTRPPEWPEKYAALYFTYGEEAYVIRPSAIRTSDDIFCVLSDMFTDDLFAVGAYDIYYSGMLD